MNGSGGRCVLRVVSPPALPPRQCMYTDHGDGCAAARVCWAWGCALRKRGRVCRYIVCVRARAPRRVACVCACVVRVVCRGPCPVPTPDAYSLWSLGAWLCVVDRIAHLDVSIVRRFTTGDTEKRDTCGTLHNPFPVRRARRVAAQGRGVCFDLIYSTYFVDVVRYLLR